MQWIAERDRARWEQYSRAVAPVQAFFEGMATLRHGGMRMAWAGAKLMLGILLLIIFVGVMLSVL